MVTLALLLSALVVSGALAQGSPPTDDEVNAVAKQLYCPVCENIPLDVCPTQACVQWRDVIREKLAEGWSETEIKSYFVTQYGDRVLAEPPRRGLNWLVYIVPPAAILAGAYILYRGMQAWRSPGPAVDTPESDPELPPDEYVARLEKELQRRR
jgi:cytochrome c-type biogenesis protein CcmH